MCGIVGLVGKCERVRFDAALGALSHRGPDDSGVWTDEAAEVTLGRRRLSIIDLSPAGHQPMVDASGRFVIVYNGEVYNYRELRTELTAAGTHFRGHSDTEVVLELYARQGVALLPRLNGIFALAIWDREERRLLLARDAPGVKPLYYTETATGFAFASELKALMPLIEQRTLDVAALHRYLTFLWCPGEGTPLKEVRRLGPGEALSVRAGRIERRWVWYRLPVFRAERKTLDAADSIAGVATQLRTAVHRQVIADVPVGAFLSGGLDSSALVAFARERAPELRCFTIELVGGQDAGFADDLPYAKRVAAHLGVQLEVVRVDSARMAHDLERMVWMLDEPQADPAPLNVLYISELARQHGIKVLLSGAGGDDLFTGYRRHRAVQLERLWNWLPPAARRGLERTTARLDQRRSWARRLAKLFNGAGLDGDARLVDYFRWMDDASLWALYSTDFRARLGRADAAAPMLDFLRPLPTGVAPLERMLALEQRFFLADHNLAYTDKMSMAVGVEVRVPFLDLELVEFAWRIPPGVKQQGSEGKWVLKKAMEPYLPHDVIYRPKSGFGAPLRRWLRHELRELLGDLLSADSLRRRGLFDPQAVQGLIADNDAGRRDAAYTLFSLLCIEIWCRAYLDRCAV